MLKALRPVLYESTLYGAGDALPATNMEMAEAWVECGSAVWTDSEDTTPVVLTKQARPAAAMAGMTGIAYPSAGPDADLVGRVPDPEKRGAVKEPAKRPGRKSSK